MYFPALYLIIKVYRCNFKSILCSQLGALYKGFFTMETKKEMIATVHTTHIGVDGCVRRA